MIGYVAIVIGSAIFMFLPLALVEHIFARLSAAFGPWLVHETPLRLGVTIPFACLGCCALVLHVVARFTS